MSQPQLGQVSSPTPPASIEAEDDSRAFATVVAGWNAAGKPYLRARVLADGAGVSPRAIVERLVDETVEAFGEASPDALVRWLPTGGAALEIVALNAGALLARQGLEQHVHRRSVTVHERPVDHLDMILGATTLQHHVLPAGCD